MAPSPPSTRAPLTHVSGGGRGVVPREGGRFARRALLGAAAAWAGCGRSRSGDGVGGASGAGPRFVSISPATTETLFALGAGADVVGRSSYCDYPPEATRLPVVGGFSDPNFEAILALRPTLVTGVRGPAGPALAGRLAALGIETFFPPATSLAEVDALVTDLAARVGREAAGRDLRASMGRAREGVARAVASAASSRVVLLVGITPIYAAGPGGFVDELLRLAGARNAVPPPPAGAPPAAFPTFGLEQLIAFDPDVLVNAAAGEAHGGASALPSTWSAVRAVREGRVVDVVDEAVLRPGPRVADGARTLARALHPGLSL